jgi:hypothetical protein
MVLLPRESGMMRRQRLIGFTVLLVFLGLAKLGQQLYRWYAFQDERAEIERLEADLEEAALGVVRTQLRADHLRREVDRDDRELAVRREALDRLERQVVRGPPIPSGVEAGYRRDLRAYNTEVAARNQRFREWLAVVDQNHGYVARYNELADSIRGLAERMGEPYYPIASPAEIAHRSGLTDGVR